MSRTDTPFVLLSPTRNLCTARTEAMLANRKSAFIPLTDEVSLAGRRKLRLRRPVDDNPVVVPNGPTSHNPKTSNRWSSFRHRLGLLGAMYRSGSLTGTSCSVQVKSERMVSNYTQMGMANRRTGDPTKQWKLLEGFSKSHGQIDWHGSYAGRQVKKRKQELSKRLRTFFRIEDDPIEWVRDTRSYYRCKFRILPVGG